RPSGGEVQPLTYARRVADTRVLAPGVQEHDDNRTPRQRHLHDQTPARLGDVPGLGQTDVPAGAAGEIVGVAEAHRAAPDLALVRSRGRIVADLGVGVRGLHELPQDLRGEHAAAGKPGAVLDARARLAH